MKSRKTNLPVEEVEAIEGAEAPYLDSEILPPADEADAVGALLRRIGDRGNYASASFAYRDLEEDDYVSEEALHRVVEDLQFGHDLRL